jgi:hypothetical protein
MTNGKADADGWGKIRLAGVALRLGIVEVNLPIVIEVLESDAKCPIIDGAVVVGIGVLRPGRPDAETVAQVRVQRIRVRVPIVSRTVTISVAEGVGSPTRCRCLGLFVSGLPGSGSYVIKICRPGPSRTPADFRYRSPPDTGRKRVEGTVVVRVTEHLGTIPVAPVIRSCSSSSPPARIRGVRNAVHVGVQLAVQAVIRPGVEEVGDAVAVEITASIGLPLGAVMRAGVIEILRGPDRRCRSVRLRRRQPRAVRQGSRSQKFCTPSPSASPRARHRTTRYR